MRKARLALALTCLAVLFLSERASASHPGNGTTYPVGWQERAINLYFSGPYWSSIGNIRARAENGASQWNGRASTGGFTFYAGTATLGSNTCNGLNVNGVFWEGLDGGTGGVLGEIRTCRYPGQYYRIESVNLVFDGAQSNWYTGTLTPATSEHDLWSTASHEFGHATGFFLTSGNHWNNIDSTLCTSSLTLHTMCSGVIGSTSRRDLATHDLYAFQDRYF